MASTNTFDCPGMTVLRPKYLAHVVLRTTPENFPQMVQYYKTFFNAHASHENDFLSFLTYDEEHHRVAIVAPPGTVPRLDNGTGLRHMAFTFDNLDDLALAYLQRKANGILPARCINHGVTTSLYYQDPDKNEIETQVDNFDSVQEMIDYMDSPDFKENPIGVNFDPEVLVRRLKAGEPHEAIKKRPNIGTRTSV
jgi:catechol-2,3-dioxygenase